jgi:tetratricopeptide (TPR) repeat protein
MMNSEIQDLEETLRTGIAAVRRRDLEQGRELLLRVVDQDDQQEQAWLWLSVAVEKDADKMVALENVLTLNPTNTIAQKRLARLKRRPGAGSEAAAPEALPVVTADLYVAGAPPEPDDGIDDPLQCPYCGQMTAEADKTCPHCGRRLFERVAKSDMSESLRTGLLVLGMTAVLGVIETIAPLMAYIGAQDSGNGPVQYLSQLSMVGLFLGNPLQPGMTITLAGHLMTAFVIRSGLLGLALVGLSQRWAAAYYTAFGLLVGDLAWSSYLVVMGYLGPASGLLNAGLAVTILALLAASDREFAVSVERHWTRPDAKARSAADFYHRGHNYRKYGLWALAVAQWRRAVGLAPKEVAYYKDLGIGYAQIGRYERSMKVLEEAQRQAPGDAQIPAILEVVRAQMARQKDLPG